MLVVFPPAIRHDESVVPSFYEDHLLERVTLLEIRLSQVAERLAMALDLMLRQTKTTQSDHLLLETLIDSLNTLGAVEKEKLTQTWRKRIKSENSREIAEDRNEKILREIAAQHDNPKADLFLHLVKESLQLAAKNEEKQALRTLERALLLSPENIALLLFIAETLFRADRFETAAEYMEKAVKISSEDEKASLLLGVIYTNSFEFKKAQKLFKLPQTTGEAKFCKNYAAAMTAAYNEDWKSALEFCKEILTITANPETHYLIGCVYFQLAKYKSALRHLQKAVELDTNYADAWFMLGAVYEIQGDETRAYQSIELAWSSHETGAQCLEFLKRKGEKTPTVALPFLTLKSAKKHLLTGGSMRLSKLFKHQLFKALS